MAWGPKSTLGGTLGASHGLVSEGEVKAATESPETAPFRPSKVRRLVLAPYGNPGHRVVTELSRAASLQLEFD